MSHSMESKMLNTGKPISRPLHGVSRKNIRIFTLLVSLFLFAGCAKEDTTSVKVVERPGETDVVYVPDDNPKMAAAIKNAQSTVEDFIQALNNPKPNQTDFSVKVPIHDGDNTEYMWVMPVRYMNGRFIGTIGNEPDRVKTVNLGDEINVAKNEICDWMYLNDGKLVGGYTIRAIRAILPKEKLQEFDKELPFTID